MPNIYLFHDDVLEFGPNEPSPYTDKDVTVYQVGTSTPVPVYADDQLAVPYANSLVPTNEFGEIRFYALLPTVDIVRVVGGRRTTHTGDPGGVDETQFARTFFFS